MLNVKISIADFRTDMMRPPIIVNDSADPETAGDVLVFETIEEAERYLETWFVDEPHCVYDEQGAPLRLKNNSSQRGNEKVRITKIEDAPARPEKVRYFLKSFLESILDAKGEKTGLT
ncbi:MAG: hypothetical protein HUJ16_00475, partial [Kangiella sp.]|nr:hypothetical protein [Kangiella sp.]